MIRRIKKNKMIKMAKKHGINSIEYYKAGLDGYSRNDLIILTRDLAKQGIELSNRIEKATNEIQQLIDGVNNRTIIGLKNFIPKLEEIQDKLAGGDE